MTVQRLEHAADSLSEARHNQPVATLKQARGVVSGLPRSYAVVRAFLVRLLA